MRQYTLKDFILYNSPCFNCGHDIYITFYIFDRDTKTTIARSAFVEPNHTSVDLIINYSSKIGLKIDHKTNKFLVEGQGDLTDYLARHILSVESCCVRCNTRIHSKKISLNLKKNFIAPLKMRSEDIYVNDQSSVYQLITDYAKATTTIVVEKIDDSRNVPPITLVAPLLPLFRFKNKSHFFEKMKLYVLFS